MNATRTTRTSFGGECVTWKSLVLVLIPALTTTIGGLGAAGAWALHDHDSHPHAGAVTANELTFVLERMTGIERDLHEVRDDVKQLIKR